MVEYLSLYKSGIMDVFHFEACTRVVVFSKGRLKCPFHNTLTSFVSHFMEYNNKSNNSSSISRLSCWWWYISVQFFVEWIGQIVYSNEMYVLYISSPPSIKSTLLEQIHGWSDHRTIWDEVFLLKDIIYHLVQELKPWSCGCECNILTYVPSLIIIKWTIILSTLGTKPELCDEAACWLHQPQCKTDTYFPNDDNEWTIPMSEGCADRYYI